MKAKAVVVWVDVVEGRVEVMVAVRVEVRVREVDDIVLVTVVV